MDTSREYKKSGFPGIALGEKAEAYALMHLREKFPLKLKRVVREKK